MNTFIPARMARPCIAVVLLSAMFLSQGCKKPEDDLGLSVLNPADTLGTYRTDTTSIITWPRTDSPVRSSRLSANLLGSYLDDRFGTVTTGIVTQLRLSVNNVGPADASLVCDSLILSLAFSSSNPIYGDPDPQTIRAFRLTQDLYADSTYTCDTIPTTDGQDLVVGSPHVFTPSPDVGPVIEGDSLPAQLRIPLSTVLGNEFLAQWGQATLADNASFLDFFKGLYIAPDNGAQSPLQAGVWSFNLQNGASKMTLYYHNSDAVASSFDFIIGAESARYTTAIFDHDLATVLGVPQALVDTTLGQVETYVQAMGSIRTEVRFPTLDQYVGSSLRAVAKAELVVPIAGEFHDTYLPPGGLFVFSKAEDGTDRGLLDQTVANLVYPVPYDEDNKEYRLNITRWVQGVLNGTNVNRGLSLVAGLNGVSVNRATLSGPANADRPMQLILTFTTY